MCKQGKKLTHAQRVANSNCTPVKIHFFVWQAEFLDRVHGLGRERFIDLEELDVLRPETRLFEHLRDSDRGADAHDPRGNASDGRSGEFADDGKTEALGGRATSE